MPISLEALKARLNPKHTILLLGAGGSVPSGAPSGSALAARLWKDIAKTEPKSDDLIDTASILERLHGRFAVVNVVRSALQDLQPTGGLLALPHFGWSAIFSTNFDMLVEQSYRTSAIPLTSIRSNYDLTNRENREGTSLYKIHGCISQDRAFGDKASMILTDQDYDEFQRYRQSMFSTLQTMMLTNDVVILGQSLSDRHLQELVKKVLSYKQDGVASEIYVLVYDSDDLRAPLLEDRGAKICFAGIDEFAHALSKDKEEPPQTSCTIGDGFNLPVALVSTVHDVKARSLDAANILRMFNGGPASYADIRAGATFERARFLDAVNQLSKRPTPIVVITGAAGVGKTTFARQITLHLAYNGLLAWEHRNDFPFQSKPWLYLEAELRAAGRKGILLLDECTRYLRQANMLIEALGGMEEPALRIVATANAAQWAPRLKAPTIFKKGTLIPLTTLVNSEINSLINLYQHNKDVGALVYNEFKALSRNRQYDRLKEKCSADMFVCLNNIFANENLDTIILTEYDDLDTSSQDYYRYVAALEAVGARVHRQLIMRMLNIGGSEVSSALNGLSGIIDEYDIKPEHGIYGWSTRHIVIARKIAEYKFSDYTELEDLFDSIVDNINPAIAIELQSVRDICDTDYGIGRLPDTKTRQRLYRRLTEAASGERIPWHRLVRELLDHEGLEDAEYGIRNAIDAVGADGPLDRYKVRLLLARADRTIGISDSDRLALVRRAYETAEANIKRHPSDKFSYKVLCEVAVKLIERGESPYVLDEAIVKFRDAADIILDPDMDRTLRYFESVRSRL